VGDGKHRVGAEPALPQHDPACRCAVADLSKQSLKVQWTAMRLKDLGLAGHHEAAGEKEGKRERERERETARASAMNLMSMSCHTANKTQGVYMCVCVYICMCVGDLAQQRTQGTTPGVGEMSRCDTSSEEDYDFDTGFDASRCDTSSDGDVSPPRLPNGKGKASGKGRGQLKAATKALGTTSSHMGSPDLALPATECHLPLPDIPFEGCNADSKAKAKPVRKAHLKAVPAAKVLATAATPPAAKAQAMATAMAAKCCVSSSSESEDGEKPLPARASGPRSVPMSSGIADYMQWAIAHVLTDAERHRLQKCVVMGSMCAGMGVDEVALTFLHQALIRHSVHFKVKACFKAEKDPGKLAFLQRHYKTTHHFRDNLSLAQNPATNSQGVPVDQPVVDILTCGIVCKDISQLNNRPKSEREDGVSGGSLKGLLAYMGSLQLELRPKVVLLECVQRLGHTRAVDPDSRRGTEYITDELAKVGYAQPSRSVTAVGRAACSFSAFAAIGVWLCLANIYRNCPT
jgi:hypothetical protein